MRSTGGLTRNQIICIALLWVALCVMMFTLPSDHSLGENIFIAVASGIIILIALKKDRDRALRKRREEKLNKMKNEINEGKN